MIRESHAATRPSAMICARTVSGAVRRWAVLQRWSGQGVEQCQRHRRQRGTNLGVGVGIEYLVDGAIVTSVHCCGQVPISVEELNHGMLVMAEFPSVEEGTVPPTGGAHADLCGDAIELDVDVELICHRCVEA